MKKIKFSELDKKTQIAMSTTPHCVYVTQNPDDETYEQIVERQEKFLKLPEKIKNKLISSEVAGKIQRIGRKYKLSLLQMASIARIIRSYYFREVEVKDFPTVLVMEMGISLDEAKKISQYVVEAIIKGNNSPKDVSQNIKLSLQYALEKYPEIKNQILSDKMIKIMGRPYPVKATIENWIKDYYGVVGTGNRDIMKRSRYLYNGENSRILNSEEKQKLAVLIKSLDEGSLVTVDAERGEIIFKNKKNIQQKKSTDKLQEDRLIISKKLPTMDSSIKSFGGIKKGINNKDVRILQRKILGKKEIDENDKKYENKQVIKSKETKITHIQGNDWSLNSEHFKKSDQKKRGIIKKIFSKKNKYNNQNSGITAKKNDGRIKFSSSQQFPVEKKENLGGDEEYLPKFGKAKIIKKNDKHTKSSFFGRIGPVDE